MSNCRECDYQQKERAGMWIDSGATEEAATAAGALERCATHADKPRFARAPGNQQPNPRK